MDNEDSHVRQLLGEITALVTAFPPALEPVLRKSSRAEKIRNWRTSSSRQRM